jgi:hypothetical protein
LFAVEVGAGLEGVVTRAGVLEEWVGQDRIVGTAAVLRVGLVLPEGVGPDDVVVLSALGIDNQGLGVALEDVVRILAGRCPVPIGRSNPG